MMDVDRKIIGNSGKGWQAAGTLILTVIASMSAVMVCIYRIMRYYMERTDEEIDKVKKGLEFYDILIRWMELKQRRKKLSEYFEANGHQTVAIYGMKEIGVLLLNELKQEGIDVRYAIDRNANEINADISVMQPSCNLPEVDVIIVTAIHYFDSIYLELQDLTQAEIISVEDILWGI